MLNLKTYPVYVRRFRENWLNFDKPVEKKNNSPVIDFSIADTKTFLKCTSN